MKMKLVGIGVLCAAAGALAMAGAWVLRSDGGAGATATRVPAPDPVASAKGGAARDGTMRSGIGVRGHWTIEVRDPDGTLARREEFDNALVWNGESLHKLLTTHRNLQRWVVTMSGPNQTYNVAVGEPKDGHPFGTQDDGNTASEGFNLVASFVEAPQNKGFTRLSGTVIARNPLSIRYVRTYIQLCEVAGCTDPYGGILTDHDLSTAVPVAAGQQVLVTVEITFQAV